MDTYKRILNESLFVVVGDIGKCYCISVDGVKREVHHSVVFDAIQEGNFPSYDKADIACQSQVART